MRREVSKRGPKESVLFAGTAAGLVVVQGYVPLPGHIDITLWQMALAFALPSMLVLSLPSARALERPAAWGLGFLFLLTLLTAPTGAGGGPALRTAAFLAITIAAYFVGYQIGAMGRFPVLLRAFGLFLAPFAICNVIFFLYPGIELTFLQSSPARLLIEPNTLENLFRPNLGNNVLDPRKAGTLFVNTNVASILFGFGICVGVYRLVRSPGLARILVVILFAAAFLATGSRAGLLAAGLSAVIVGLLVAWRIGAGRALRWTGIGALLAAGLLSLPMGRAVVERLAVGTVSGDPRLLIWAHGARLVATHPIRGIGFHGWAESFPSFARVVGLSPTLPPHNAYLIAWLWLGLAGLVAMTIVFIGSLVSFARLTANRWLMDLGLLGASLVTWFGVQLFFTNFALLEPRVGGAFFLLVGAVYGAAEYRKSQVGPAQRRAEDLILTGVRGLDHDRLTR